MSATISLTQSQIFTGLGAVLHSFGLVPPTIQIVQGQVNRVPSPAGSDYIVLWPIARNRLAMNIDTQTDIQCIGAIFNNVLTATSVPIGPLAQGQTIYGTGVAAGCQIVNQINGPTGGAGTYTTTPTANATGTFYCGTSAKMQETEVTIQADVHGPNSADNSARIQTLFRDQFGCDAFAATGVALAPLYTSDPRQTAFENGEQQVEERWSIDLTMQANVTITVTQQFADKLQATATSVATIPA